MRLEQGIDAAMCVSAVTGPGVIARIGNDVRPDWIEFDISVAGQDISFALH